MTRKEFGDLQRNLVAQEESSDQEGNERTIKELNGPRQNKVVPERIR